MEEKEKATFAWSDLERWASEGLISEAQLVQIRSHLYDTAKPASSRIGEDRNGLNFVTVAYYFGGFMFLLASTIFIGLQWESLASATRVGAVAIPIALLWTVGGFLRRNGFPRAGGVLVFAGTGIIPLLVYTLETTLNLWPESPNGANGNLVYRDFYRAVASSWVWIEVSSLLIALEVLRRVRFPLITLLIAVWAWFLSMDAVRWTTESRPGSWGDTEQIVGTMLGLGMLLFGVVLRLRTRLDYSLWFLIIGHITVFSHFSALVVSKEGALGPLYLGLYLLFAVASVLLKQRVFLVFGALGCYSYASYPAFSVFEGSLGFVYALATLGLVIVFTAVGYQRYVRSWLEQRLYLGMR